MAVTYTTAEMGAVSGPLVISNEGDGGDIASTNFWNHPMAQRGFLFLSWNAGVARLLVPAAAASFVREMRTGREAIISRGHWPEAGGDGIEVLFEDHSNAPFAIHLMIEQTDRLLPKTDSGTRFRLSVWTPAGRQLEMPGRYRVVPRIPSLKPW